MAAPKNNSIRRLGTRLVAAAATVLALAAEGAGAVGPAQAPGAAAAEMSAPAGRVHSSRPAGVAWFDGEITDAFALARTTGRPVFLYWGAVWCPPCQELKATVFKRRDFLDRLNLFVPVYLDGDAAGAQAWGERFKISGYPTVLVLRADQTELARVSGGMDLARYAEVLELALGQDRPVQELLAAVASPDPSAISPDECRRLAYNAWMLDDAWVQHPESLGGLAQQLGRAAQRCPQTAPVERARLQVTAVHAAVSAETKDLQSGRAPSAPLRGLLEPVPGIVSNAALAPAIGDALWYLPAEFFSAAATAFPQHGAKTTGQGREALRRRWFVLMDELSADPRYSPSDQLDALRSKLVAAKALSPDGKISALLATAVTRRIDQALAREHEPYARSSLVNSALNVLDVLGDDRRAHDILAGEVKSAAYPYYYMADLGELEEKLGHVDLAIDWLARSYQYAQGPATRFQWGVGYVRGLVRMRPKDDAAIRSSTLSVLSDLDAAADLHGRTLRALWRLEASLRDWNKDASHATAIEAVRERMRAICQRVPADDSAHPVCMQFLINA
jgi:thiol-disulfide isomerase/thioredoxin